MVGRSTTLLGALRQRIRGVALALLPALTLAAASAPACAAMDAASGTPLSATQAHDSHAHSSDSHAHAQHEHDSSSPASTEPCPHCPLETGAANAGHAVCAVGDGQTGAAISQTSVGPDLPAAALLPHWMLPAADAIPPLIGARVRQRTTLPPAVPLNIRHCVYLI